MLRHRDKTRPNAICILAVAFSLLSPVSVLAGDVEADVSSEVVRADMFPKAPVRFAHGVIAEPDIEYSNLAGFRPLLLDLYRPEKFSNAEPRPLVIYIHGGYWDRGDSRSSGAFTNFPGVLASLAARGYVVASINYRLAAEAHFPAQIRDVNAAIGYLRANAARYGLDPARVILWGGSAGGQLAALAATSCGTKEFEAQPSSGRQPKSSDASSTGSNASYCVQGAVIWYGIFDFSPLLTAQAENTQGRAAISNLLGCQVDECPAAVEKLSPISHVSASAPPMLLVHGTDDRMVPATQAQAMADRLQTMGVPVETLVISGVDHALVGKTPAATREANLLALRRSFDFIDKVTKPGKAAIGQTRDARGQTAAR